MKADISPLIKIAHTTLLATIVTFVALVAVELWTFNDPGSMIELRSGVTCRGKDSEVYFRLQNTAGRTINFTFSLELHQQMVVEESEWSVSICPGSDFKFVLYPDGSDGLRKVSMRIHREGESNPIRDVTYFLLDDEATQA